MKMTLISLYTAVSAIGVRWLSSYLKTHGHTTQVLFLPDPALELYSPQLLGDVTDLCSDSLVVGISLASNLVPQAIQLTSRLKSDLPQALVVWGGVHPSLRPEDSLAFADAVCIGEGELPLTELMDKIERGEDYLQTQSFWFRQGEAIIRNKIRAPIEDLDSLGFPDYDFEGHYIKKKNRVVPMTVPLLLQNMPLVLDMPPETYVTIATRGCPHNCAFCSVPALRRAVPPSKRHRQRSKDHVIGELRTIRRQYPFFKQVEFSDDNLLSAPTDYLLPLLHAYQTEVALPLIVTGVDSSSLNEVKMQALADAGLSLIRMGIQTGAEATKALYNRGSSNDRILEATRLIHKYSHQLWVPPLYDLILDNPWEGEQDLLETLNLLLEIPRPYKLIFFSLTFFTGTELTERALREKKEIREGDDFDRVKRTYFNGVFYLLNVPHFPKAVLRFLMKSSVRRSRLFAWLPFLVLPAFRARDLVRWASRDLAYGSFGRIRKFFLKRVPRRLLAMVNPKNWTQ